MSNSITKSAGGGYPIFAGGKVVGKVKSAVFSKQIKGSKHLLLKPRAIALDVDSLRQAKDYGAKTIRITDMESGIVYSCDMAHFDRHSFELNRGFGSQRALPLDRWTVTAGMKVNTPLPVPEPSKADCEAIQMSLFAGGVA